MAAFTLIVISIWVVSGFAFWSFLPASGGSSAALLPVMIWATVVAGTVWLGGYLMTWSLRHRA